MTQEIKLEYIKKKLREQYSETTEYLELIDSDPRFADMETIETAIRPEPQDWIVIDIPYEIAGKPIVLSREDGFALIALLGKAESSSQLYNKPFTIFSEKVGTCSFTMKFLSNQAYKLAKLTYLISGKQEGE